MTMNEVLVLAVVSGFFLGTLFFGGLWWTVRKGMSAKQPALLFLGSTVLRAVVTVAGFYVVSDGHWQQMLACLAGFTVARFVVMRFSGAPIDIHNSSPGGADRAP